MLTNQPISTPDELLVQTLIKRYAKTLPADGDLNLMAMLRVDNASITHQHGNTQIGVDAIVLLIPNDALPSEPQHAHYRIDLEFSITLVPCPNGH